MDDRKKQQLMLGLVVFNFTVMGYVFYRFFTAVAVDWNLVIWSGLIGAGLGLITGGIAYFVAGMGK